MNGSTTPHDYQSRDQRTDRTRWRLLDERGRQRWKYLRTEEEVKEWPLSLADRWHLGLPVDLPSLPPAKTPLDAATNGLSFFENLQLPPGNWACEYGGPLFLLPGIVIAWYVTNTPISEEYRIEISNYLFARQNKEDFGWGLHIEGESSVFGTAMNYTVLRLLGQDSEDPMMIKARSLLHKFGGATNGPHWAKFWLSLLGLYEWEGVNPVPPELWLLPDWMPIAPWRWWIHMRQVFLPMSYLYSKKYVHPLTPITRSLRNELYTQPYSSINFFDHRNTINPGDNYHPKTPLLNSINWFLVNIHFPFMRIAPLKRRAEAQAYQLIQYEDENTDFGCLAPVNAPVNTICRYITEGPDCDAFQRHIERLDDFLWMKDEGLLCNGTNGVQTWDTAFAIQAALSVPGIAESSRWKPMLTRALEFLEDQQIREECRSQVQSYRQSRKGAWAFSTRDQGYTVSDCTSEALKSVLLLQNTNSTTEEKYPQLVSDERAKQAVDVLLTMQNASGGFASYEPTRGSAWLMEQLNAAEVFGRIMVEYDYPECTTAVVTALSLFSKLYPDYRRHDIQSTVERAVDWIRKDQRDDGSWYGSWGICFTYAGMFALESLASVGETYKKSERVRRACGFFVDRQNGDGGWGESYKSCEDGVWRDHPEGSQVVQTAWAVIGLLEAGYEDDGGRVMERAVELIMSRQQANGEWPQEGIEGVFNKTCMISYPNYKFIFPIKALGMYASRTGNMSIL